MVRSDESPIRVGLVGYGYVEKTFHAPLIRSVPGLELTMVASSQPEAVLTDISRAQVLRDPMAVALTRSWPGRG